MCLNLRLRCFPSNGAAGSKDYKELSIAADRNSIKDSRWQGREREAVDSSNPVFNIAMESCILCQRCVQACQDGHQFIGAIDLLGTSTQGRIGTFAERPLVESVCTTCGQCLSVCPTGAIEVKTPPLKVAKEVTTTCPYCGVGCGIKAQVDDTDRIVAMLDDPDNQSSIGMLCVKGRFGYSFVNHEDRLTSPLIRKDGILTEASWDEALEYVAVNLARYRGDEFATLCSAKATNEDGYIQQKFSRLVMQSNHIDHCTRLCHSPSVEAMLTSLGSGATSNSYQDYEEAGCLVIIGSDANSNHPVAASRMRRAVIERGAKLIVVNPRRIEMCDFAELWLRPRPGTDVALLNAMAKVILDEDLVGLGFRERPHRGFRGVARAHRQLHSRLCRKHHRRGCRRHRTGGANIREASVQRFLPDMGYGHHAAYDGHSERAQPAEPVVRCRTTRQARLRHIASAWTEQCAGLRRRGLPAQCFSRLSDNF